MAYLGGGSNSADDVYAGNIAATFSPAVSSGSLLFAAVSWYTGDGTTTITSLGDGVNTWQFLGPTILDANNQATRFAYALNSAGGATTVTATFSANVIYRRLVVAEYSGVATTSALDGFTQQNAANTTAANGATSGAITTTVSGDLVVGAMMDTVNGLDNMAAGTGFTLRGHVGGIAVEDLTQGSAGSIAATWTLAAAGRVTAGVAAFKAAGGGGAASVTPADSAHGHAAESPTLTQTHATSPADSAHGHTADAATLTQVHALAPADSTHGHTAGAATLTQAHALTAANSSHTHGSESPTLATGTTLLPADSSHGHATDAPTLTQAHNLTPDSSDHTHAADTPALTQVHQLAPVDSTHSHVADSPLVFIPSGLPPPAARTVVTPPEVRTLTVAAETRIVTTPAETRIITD